MIKIAQIGVSLQSHGKQIWKSINSNPDLFEAVGYALPENEREKFPEKVNLTFENAREMTVEEILSDPEITAVAIETEEKYLTKYALMAAKAGKHIHMEKPGSQSLCDFEKLIETVRRNNTVFHTGYMYRYNPFVKELIQKIRNGELGEIISVEAQMNCKHKDELREWLSGYKGGSMFYLGCHLIDLILLIQGTPENIIPFNRPTNFNGIVSEDYGFVVMEYKNGVSFAKVCSLEKGGYARRQLVVTGTKATAVIEPLEQGSEAEMTSVLTYSDRDGWHEKSEVRQSDVYDRYRDMMRSFGEYVSGVKQNPYTLDYELDLYKTILKCCRI